MIFKRLLLTFCLFITPLFLFGCQNSTLTSNMSKSENELVISVGSNLADGNYDPCTGFAANGFHIFHSALLKFDENALPTYDLAKSYVISDDKLVYTFKLNEGIKFSNGAPLTAHDVAFTYMTTKEKGLNVDLSFLREAKALDNYTVEFTLDKPWSTFLINTAQLGIVPKDFYDQNYAKTGIGTGPFKLLQYDVDQQLIIAPNEYYYGTKPNFERISILTLDEQAALAAAKAGNLDLVIVNPEYSKIDINGMHLVSLQTIDNRCVSMPMIPYDQNSGSGNDITSDPAIRQALNIGINREEIIKNALNGVGIPAYGRVDSMPWNGDHKFTDGKTDEAIAILNAGGWFDSNGDGILEKNGKKAEFTVVAGSNDMERYQLAVAFSDSAKPLGINILTGALPWDEAVNKSKTCGFVWGFGDFNPSEFYNWYHSDARNVSYYNPSNYSSAKADDMIQKALGARTQEEAISYWKKLQYDKEYNTGTEIDLPFIWLVNIKHNYFVKDGLDIGKQIIHPHGHGIPVLGNLKEWRIIKDE